MNADDIINAYESRLKNWNDETPINMEGYTEDQLRDAYNIKRKRDEGDKKYLSFRRKSINDKTLTPSPIRRQLDEAYNEKHFENVRAPAPQQPPTLPPRPRRKVSVKISPVPQKPSVPAPPPREAKTPVPQRPPAPPTPPPRERKVPVPQNPPALPPRPNDFLNELRKKAPKMTPKTRTQFLGKVLREKKRQHDPPRKVSRHNDRIPANASPPVPKPIPLVSNQNPMGTIPEHNVESKPTGFVAWAKGLLKKNDAQKSTENPQQKSTGNPQQKATGVPHDTEPSKLDSPEMSARREPQVLPFPDKDISRARSTDRIKTELPPRTSKRRRHSDMSKKRFGSATTKRFKEQFTRRSSKHSGTEMPKKATLNVQENFDAMNMYVRSIIVAREFYLNKLNESGLHSIEKDIIKQLKSRQEELKLPENSNPISEDKAKTDSRYMKFFRSHLEWARKFHGIPNLVGLVEKGLEIEAQRPIPKGTPMPERPPPAPPGRTPNEQKEDFDTVESDNLYIQNIYDAFIARPDYKQIVEDIKRIVSDIYSHGWQSFCKPENSQGIVQIAELESKLKLNNKVRNNPQFNNTHRFDEKQYAEYCNLLTQEYATTDTFIGNRVGINYDQYKKEQPPTVNSIGTFEKPFGQINGTIRNKLIENHIKYDADIFVFNGERQRLPVYLIGLIDDQILAYKNISQTLSKQNMKVPPTPIFFAMLEKNEYKISLWGYDVARIEKPQSVPRERHSKTRRRMDSKTLQTLAVNNGTRSLAQTAENLQAYKTGRTKRRTPVPLLQETSQEREYIKNITREAPVKKVAPETNTVFPKFISELYTPEQLKCIDAAALNRGLVTIAVFSNQTKEEQFKRFYPNFESLYDNFKSKSCVKKRYVDPLIDALLQKKRAALEKKFPKLASFTMAQLECLDEEKYKTYVKSKDPDVLFILEQRDFPTLYLHIGNGKCGKKAERVQQRKINEINKRAQR